MTTSEKNNSEKININDLLKIGNDVLKHSQSNTKAGIYKPNLFEGMNDREKKSTRIKLRNKLQNYIETLQYWHEQKNEAQAKKTASYFVEYANNVYNDVRILFESNTNELKQANISQFQKLVEIYTAKKQSK